MFEASFVKDLKGTNEFTEATLNVTYTRPDGTTVDFIGFPHGDGVWKLRFMPDQPGAWRYRAKFSNGVEGPSGAFRCVSSTIPGMISKDETNPMWFGFNGGKHRLIRALHVGDRFFATRDNTETGEPWNARCVNKVPKRQILSEVMYFLVFLTGVLTRVAVGVIEVGPYIVLP